MIFHGVLLCFSCFVSVCRGFEGLDCVLWCELNWHGHKTLLVTAYIKADSSKESWGDLKSETTQSPRYCIQESILTEGVSPLPECGYGLGKWK